MRLALALAALVISSPAAAGERCMVSDPTGTPLNVRADPNGAILGALHNGALVVRMNTVADSKGRAGVASSSAIRLVVAIVAAIRNRTIELELEERWRGSKRLGSQRDKNYSI